VIGQSAPGVVVGEAVRVTPGIDKPGVEGGRVGHLPREVRPDHVVQADRRGRDVEPQQRVIAQALGHLLGLKFAGLWRKIYLGFTLQTARKHEE
jgi:hypothetical protein